MFRFHRRTLLVVALLLLGVSFAGANDVAAFANLGFSRDSEVFLFGQYGIGQDGVFADIYAVDVPRNVFLPGGRFSMTSNTEIGPGQSGVGALYTLIPETKPIVTSRSVDHLRQGRIIYLLINGAEPRSEQLSFRDFETGNRYEVTLIEETRGEGETMSAAFFIELDIEFANGTRDSFRVGRPGFFREDAQSYRIRQILLSPSGRSLVIVVEKVTQFAGGTRVRYMVETIQFR